ncbi:MAG: aldo/keto reductase [Rubrivivax sp.]|jgi:diketogulonate reductase-like aldo/keto reductase|nr:aldo/keto reductase [Rubrivivax sp.]
MQRRDWLAAAAALAAMPLGATAELRPARTMPRSGEALPGVGLGTWLTFHVDPDDAGVMAARRAVLEAFFGAGGALIDSSPMYDTAEQVLGRLLPGLPGARRLYSATKVWTPFEAAGPGQLERSLQRWGLPRFDLLQVHNLLAWRGHMRTLTDWKARGLVRHLGVTTSHGNKHDEMRDVLEAEGRRLDVLQITYNPVDRRAEPLMQRAADLGLAVIVNRPFDGGDLLRRLARVPLPPLAAELQCTSWAALVLKWELSHPAVTVAIPATRRADHCLQNMEALRGPLPDLRARAALGAEIERALGA